MKNGEERQKIYTDLLTKALRKHLGLDFFSRKHVFSPKTAEMHSIGVRDKFTQPTSPIYSQNGEVLAIQRLFEEDF